MKNSNDGMESLRQHTADYVSAEMLEADKLSQSAVPDPQLRAFLEWWASTPNQKTAGEAFAQGFVIAEKAARDEVEQLKTQHAEAAEVLRRLRCKLAAHALGVGATFYFEVLRWADELAREVAAQPAPAVSDELRILANIAGFKFDEFGPSLDRLANHIATLRAVAAGKARQIYEGETLFVNDGEPRHLKASDWFRGDDENIYQALYRTDVKQVVTRHVGPCVVNQPGESDGNASDVRRGADIGNLADGSSKLDCRAETVTASGTTQTKEVSADAIGDVFDRLAAAHEPAAEAVEKQGYQPGDPEYFRPTRNSELETVTAERDEALAKLRDLCQAIDDCRKSDWPNWKSILALRDKLQGKEGQ